MRSAFVTLASLLGILAGLPAKETPVAPPPAAGYVEKAQPFLAKHCMACHNEKQSKAGFRVDKLNTDFAAPKAADHWKEVIDRINVGEMPPAESPRPTAEEIAGFVGWVNENLKAADSAAKNAGGRIPMRRLNRDEYANTIRDLLKLDANIVASLVEELPGDGKAEGFDRLGVALFFDQTQIERSLTAASKIASKAVVSEPPKTNVLTQKFPFLRAKPPGKTVESYANSPHLIPRGADTLFIKPEYVEFLQGGPTYTKELAEWGVIDHFAIGKVVLQDGDYRFRIKAKVDQRGRTEKNRLQLQYAMKSPIQTVKEVDLDPSGVTELTMFLRGPNNGEVKGPQTFSLLWNHNQEAIIPEPEHFALARQMTALSRERERKAAAKAPQSELDSLRVKLDGVLEKLNTWKGPKSIHNPAKNIEKLARLQITSIEIEGPIQKEWPPASHKALGYEAGGRSDEAYVREMFGKFLPRAYRRPVTAAEIDAVVKVVMEGQKAKGSTFPQAIRAGLQRVLCSPSFLFLSEPAGSNPQARPLTDYEFASRLSYFLWSSMPDDELFALATAGKLKEPATVKAQITRMLADAKAAEFVKNFAGQWLSVREYGAIQPAATYRNYDKALERASQREPLEFFAEVLQKNEPITAFLDSDFVMVNERLAEHYGIAGVKGTEFRRVAIRPENHRGGILGMAGLMTFLADGTRTLPMRRGSWVLRELFNDPPNDPPPNAGEIQPNTGGKNLTVRARLELHRNDAVCASCHSKLDPYGLALENYDAIGQWREKANGEGFRANQAPVLDVSGKFPDGSAFSTLEEYKAGLLAKKEKFARAFSAKLLIYALGRPVGYTDTALIDSLGGSLKSNEYRILSLIDAIVASEAFTTK